jgi:hypothetical protein
MNTKNNISEITRRDIFDFFSLEKINLNGRLEETDFLSRIFDLQNMPSTDGRFSTAYSDIYQHRINNYDWDDYWILNDSRFNLLRCKDDIFLKFLCEIVHPVVRPDKIECENIVNTINTYLKKDNYVLYSSEIKSGKQIYSIRHLLQYTTIPNFVKEIYVKLDSNYIANQIKRMESSIDDDPEGAIGASKEFIETICKTILFENGNNNIDKFDFNALVKETRSVLNILPENISKEKQGARAFRKILQSASTVLDGIGEIRNLYGTGHGKIAGVKGLESRHARLTVGIAGTLGRFLFDCYERKKLL